MRYLFLLLFFVCYSAYACEVVDDAGRVVKLAHPARRIISLAPDLTELLFAAGAGSQIVGVMRGSDFPAQAKKIPIVASFNQVDAEHIFVLQPDLIVAWAESSIPAQLKKFAIPVYISHQRKLTDVPVTLKRLGCLAGTERIANAAASRFQKRYTALQKKYSRQKKMTVFYQLWPQPLLTVTKASWINDVLVLCGGENIFANLYGAAPAVSVEGVISADPAVIVAAGKNAVWQQLWHHWSQLAAVKNNNLFTVPPDLLERAGPRVLDGAERVCYLLARVRAQ